MITEHIKAQQHSHVDGGSRFGIGALSREMAYHIRPEEQLIPDNRFIGRENRLPGRIPNRTDIFVDFEIQQSHAYYIGRPVLRLRMGRGLC